MENILILGGGYAGLSAALGLEGTGAQVTLVNRHSYHHMTTLLHQPVVGRRSYQDVSVWLKEVLPSSIQFIRGTVDAIDPSSRSVHIKTRKGKVIESYDLLVVALGWEPRFFNIPGLKEHALTLHSLNTSRLTKDRIEESLIAYDENPEDDWRTTIVIGGGGLTGVELAAELVESRRKLALSFDLEPGNIRLILIEASPALLSSLDPWLSAKATEYLQDNGVECMTDARITEVRDHVLSLSDGSAVKAGTIIWTGGVRGNSILERCGFPVNRQGRAAVNEFLQAKDHPDIFIAGDCSLTYDNVGKPLPPTAYLAVQQGRHAARNIRRLSAEESLAPYIPKTRGMVLSLGRRHAVGIVLGRRVHGKTAAVLKDALAFNHIREIGGVGLLAKKLWEWAPYLIHLHRG
ncbi:MAG TPA: NAD(P)/FAD-dependent oxidoreductase [Deltaproteobacteria bacterium]|nr:NAD(P)/FAD-dependent oxidoreductase [Deltaproteobacteria bacterium]